MAISCQQTSRKEKKKKKKKGREAPSGIFVAVRWGQFGCSEASRKRQEDVLSIDDMTVTHGFCSCWVFGRLTRRNLMVSKRIGLSLVETLPLGGILEEDEGYSNRKTLERKGGRRAAMISWTRTGEPMSGWDSNP